MGSVVKAVTKPFKSIASAVGGAVTGLAGGNKSQPQPQIVNQTTAPAAQAAPQIQPQQATGPDESSSGAGTAALRAGKKKLTIRRTNVGGGSGLNV